MTTSIQGKLKARILEASPDWIRVQVFPLGFALYTALRFLRTSEAEP